MMDYVEYTLMDLLEGKHRVQPNVGDEVQGISLKKARRIMSQLLNGLAHVHGLGLIHRDIKLENILCSADGHVVKLFRRAVDDAKADVLLQGKDPERLVSWLSFDTTELLNRRQTDSISTSPAFKKELNLSRAAEETIHFVPTPSDVPSVNFACLIDSVPLTFVGCGVSWHAHILETAR